MERANVNNLLLKFGKEYVIGFLVCMIHLLLQEKGNSELTYYIQEYESITGEAVPIEDLA
jgi:hypothetical protein